MTRKSLLNADVQQECLARIDKLTNDTKPEWGKMNAAQMLAHCAEIQEVINGSKLLEGTPFIAKLFKGMIRKLVFNDTPYSKNARTHPQYLVTDQRSLDTEKARLAAALKHLAGLSEPERRQLNHALFGSMTDEEIGWGSYKHLDYHLSQFGV